MYGGGRYLRCLALGVCLGSCTLWMSRPALALAKMVKPEKSATPNTDGVSVPTKAAQAAGQAPPASVAAPEKRPRATQAYVATPYRVVPVTPPRKRPPAPQRRCASLQAPMDIVDVPRLIPCPTVSTQVVPAAYTLTRMSPAITPCAATLAPPVEMDQPSSRPATLGMPIEIDDADDGCLTLPAFELFSR